MERVHFGGPFCVRLGVANHDAFSTLEIIEVEIFLEILPVAPITLLFQRIEVVDGCDQLQPEHVSRDSDVLE